MAKALIKLGYQVIPISYRDIISKHGHDYYYKYLIYILKEKQPFLTIFCKHNGVNSEIIKECNKFTKTWLFNPDPRKTIEQCMEVVEQAKLTNFCSSTASDVSDWFKSFGANSYHIIQGVDTEIFKRVEPEEKYLADISFIGTKTKERDEYFNILKESGYNVKFYGTGYSENEMIDEEFSKICSSSKCMLSLNTYNNQHKDYFSNRLVRYLACGSNVFHLDTTGTLEKYFRDGIDIFYFKDKYDLLNKLLEIGIENNINHVAISRIKEGFTWEVKMKRLLDIVGKNDNTL
jgi:spore maturation protein CgeB